jgi:hypothetical protein
MPTDNRVDLQKHYDMMVADLKELFLEKFDTIYTIMAHEKESLEEARKLAVDAMDKHFLVLNNAKQTQDEFKNSYVSNSIYFPKIEALEEKVRNQQVIIDEFLKKKEADKEERKGRDNRLYTWLAALTITLIGFGLNYFFGR